MKKHIRGLTVSLVTLSTGIALAFLFRTPVNHESNQLSEKTAPVIVETKPATYLPPVEYARAAEIPELSIVIEDSESRPHPPARFHRYIKLTKNGPTKVDFDLDDDIDNRELTLSFRHRSAEYRVFQRYRNSLTISLEGPHVDLDNWRHYDSPWIQLRSLDNTRFRTLASEQIDASRFPATTRAEILKAVRKLGVKGWDPDELVKDCNGPNVAPYLVTVSSMYLRVQKKVRAGWMNVGVVEIRIPMGC